MKRKAMKRKKDKKVFTQTANHVKKVNVEPKLSREVLDYDFRNVFN